MLEFYFDIHFLAPLKRKASSNPPTTSSQTKKRTKVIPGSSLPPQGFTGTVLAANHPTVVYELLERVLEEATAEHRRIVAERYGFDVKHLHFAWRTIKWVSGMDLAPSTPFTLVTNYILTCYFRLKQEERAENSQARGVNARSLPTRDLRAKTFSQAVCRALTRQYPWRTE